MCRSKLRASTLTQAPKVETWSFDTNLNTKGKLHCIFPFYLFFLIVALFYFICSVIFLLFLFIYFFILCFFSSLCNYFLIDVLFFFVVGFLKLKHKL
jgi:hypothetical protein